jgi:hypothetical protein
LEGEISDHKLGTPDLDDDSIADLLCEMLLVDSDRSEATIIEGRQDPILEGVFKLGMESHCYETQTVIDICINNAIRGTEGTQHLCPDRRVALICWKTEAGEPWRC